MNRHEELRQRIAALGFDDVRYSAAASVLSKGLRDWLSAGYQADMAWMERTADKRLTPDFVLSGVRSIIVLGVNYWNGRAAPPASRPRFSRYSQHADYHDTLKAGLVRAGKIIEELYGVTGADYRYYTDSGPVLERNWAARAGIGFVGKNAMLISRTHGNWLLLSAILTRLDLPPDPPLGAPLDPPKEPKTIGLHCGKCTRCLDACPTQAFPAPGVLDARRCISYQTIENRGIIPCDLRPGIGTHIFGCDICLEVCPWNRFAREGRSLLLSARYDLAELTWPELLTLTPEGFAAKFRKTPIKRLKLPAFLRNACIAAGNTADPTLIPYLLPLAAHPHPLVRLHAVWALHRLSPGAPPDRLRELRSQESDPAVLAEYDHHAPLHSAS
jgi:epoxyqueuosine reductase